MAACAVGLSTTLPWLRAGLGDDPKVYAGTDLTALTVLIAAAAVAILVAALVEGVARRGERLPVTMVLAAATAAATGLLIVVLEIAAALIPGDFLPVTIRRLTVDLSAGIGLWVAFVSSALGALAALGPRGPLHRLVAVSLANRGSGRRTGAVALLLAATVVVGWLRYEPWLDASAAGQATTLEGSAMPWIGPLSLLALWLLIAALGVALLTRREVGALFAAGAGWLVTFVAALAIVVGETLGRLRSDDLPVEQLRGSDLSFGATGAAWSAFAAGLAAAAAGALLLTASRATARPLEKDSWAPS